MSDPKRAAPHEVVEPGASLFAGRRMLTVPPDWQPTLLVVIDTEEEFDWRAAPNPASRDVTNVQLLPMLQAIFRRHDITPAYLVDHPVATEPQAVAVLRPWAEAGLCEVGAHLHPWVTPPVEETVDSWHAFACNLPPDLERRKLETLTAAIRDGFGAGPRIFKAGAYGVSPHTARFLADLGYRVDSSVVPHTSFKAFGGPDFTGWTTQPFETVEGIVELPLTAGFAGRLSRIGHQVFPTIGSRLGHTLHLPGVAARLSLLERLRLTPEGHKLSDMVRLTRAALGRGERMFMMTLHSSSLLPAATEYVRTEAGRDAFLQRIEDYIRYFLETVGGRSMKVSDAAAALAGPHAPPNA